MKRPVNSPVPAAPARALFYLTKNSDESHLGRIPITTDGNGHQTVLMTREEARYWVDQGALSMSTPPEREKRIEARKQASAEADTSSQEQLSQEQLSEEEDAGASVLENHPRGRRRR
jgi:hypothetical protein